MMALTEQFTTEIKTFAALFLAGFGNDMQNATEALKKSNEVLAENPRIIPAIADEENQKLVGELIKIVESGKGDIFKIIPKVTKLAKKLKI